MSQIFSPPGKRGDDDEENVGGSEQLEVQSIDDLLDEVEGILSTDSETFVNSFVQKGGQ